jgi:hypothetical protein
MLYAGTERGIYVSFDDGARWQPLQVNLPVTPVHDIAVQAHERDLVIATHGRSFWILDDLTPLYQLAEVSESPVYLFTPGRSYRMGGFSFERPGLALGKNPPNGAVIYYKLERQPKASDSLKLEFYDLQGSLVKSFAGESTKNGGETEQSGDDVTPTCPADSGVNRFIWDMRYPDAKNVPGAVFWGGSLDGPQAVPGVYTARLSIGGKKYERSFTIEKDPRLTTTPEDFKEQFNFLIKIRDKVTEAHEAVKMIRDIRRQTTDLVSRLDKHPAKDSVRNAAKRINDKLKSVEEEIMQVKLKSNEDALNYPIKLNDKIATLSGVVGSADAKPTKQSYDVFAELSGKLEKQLEKYRTSLKNDLPEFNKIVKQLDIPAVILKPESK